MKILEDMGSAKTNTLAMKVIRIQLKDITVTMNLATHRVRELLGFERRKDWIKVERARGTHA